VNMDGGELIVYKLVLVTANYDYPRTPKKIMLNLGRLTLQHLAVAKVR